MKVCIASPIHIPGLLPFFTPSQQDRLRHLPGAGGYNVTQLVIARKRQGLRTVVVSLDTAASRLEYFEGDGIEYIVCPRRLRGLLRDAYARERKHLCEAIRLSGADIVHAHWNEYALGALDSGKPTLVTLHDHPLRMLMYLDARWLLGVLYGLLVLRRGSYFTAVSPSVASFARSISRRNVPVVPNCYPPCAREMVDACNLSAPLSEGRLRIISMLNSAPFKNALGGLKTFNIIRRQLPIAEYVLVGPGLGDGEELARGARRLGITSGVRFMGNVPNKEALNLLAGCDVLFHPSLQEACSNAVIEGMAFGRLVVVACNWADAAWLVGDGGLLVNGKKPKEMADAILRAVQNPIEIQKMCARASSIVQTRFSPEQVVAQYEAEYARIVR